MRAARNRLSICAAILVLAFLIVRELRAAPPAFPVSADRSAARATLALPSESVSIGTLMVGTHEVRVGDLATTATAALTSSAVLKATADDSGTIGRRQIRAYQLDDASVTVVLEPFEPRGAFRVAAIYLR